MINKIYEYALLSAAAYAEWNQDEEEIKEALAKHNIMSLSKIIR